MANVLFKRGNTATINGTAIADGQLLYNTTTGQHYIDSGSTRKEVGKPVDTTLSTTSTNAIANKTITTSIVNTTAEVNAITADNIPCGTKPVKELIKNFNETGNAVLLGDFSSTYSSTENRLIPNLPDYKYIQFVWGNTANEYWIEPMISVELMKLLGLRCFLHKLIEVPDTGNRGLYFQYVDNTHIKCYSVYEIVELKVYGIK